MNTLYWEDIDFNILKPGMITRGPATVSMAEYLNVFRDTITHRLEFFGISVSNPDNLRFEIGEQRSPSDSILDFPSKYRQLFTDIKKIFIVDFYSAEILDDPLNKDTYILPKPEDEEFALLLEVDQDTVDLFNEIDFSTQSPGLNKIFTADMLRLLYQILSTYTISEKIITNNSLPRGGSEPIEPNSLTRDVREWYFGRGSSVIENTLSYQEVNDAAYSDYTNRGLSKLTINTRFQSVLLMSELEVEASVVDDVIDTARASYDSYEGAALVWSYKNKDDEFVDVNFTAYGKLILNTDRDTGGKYFSQFPEVDFGDDPVDININEFKSVASLEDEGVMSIYNTTASNPTDFIDKLSISEDTNVIFKCELAPTVFADSNSFGFDFFVEPGLWPPIEEE